ncbi:Alpha/Beta hydrolase protein [Zygosaccharomyces rouxii]|nr:Alpha/Beta hydrolase protein [Zygosaccharomyces rouxii]
MDALINSRYKKQTKIIEAVWPRSHRDAVLVNGKDKLQLVYDVYTCVNSRKNGSGIFVNLLFIHASGMSRSVWDYHVAHLFDYEFDWNVNKIVTLDQASQGDSGVLNADLLGVQQDWVDGARDACKVAQNEFSMDSSALNIVIGHSAGGFQALSSGVLLPNLFQFIIIVEPVVYMNYVTLSPGFYQALLDKMQDVFPNDEAYQHYMDRRSMYTTVHPSILNRVKDFEKIVIPNGNIRTKISRRQHIICYMSLHSGASWLINSLSSIKVPVIGIFGGVSKWAPRKNRQILREKIPDYLEEMIPGGDHLLNLEQPDKFLGKLVDHISGFVSNEGGQYLKSIANDNLSIDQRRKKFEIDFENYKKTRVKVNPPPSKL